MPDSTGQAVFLSYASQDAEAARRIAETLRQAGVVVWFDQNELVGGDAWDAKIRRQISECALFVPIISANTQARLEGYFRVEWKLAAQRTHGMAETKPFLLPVVIDDTRDTAAEVPGEFRAVQWTWLDAAAAPGAFAERVLRLLGGSSEARSTGRAAGHALLPTPPAPPPEENFWVAVLPFKHRGADPEVAALAEGMTQGVATGLSRFSYLRVIASNSTVRYADDAVDVRSAGRELGARYVLEGSLRQAGGKLRVIAQLVETTSGAHLWAEHYDRPFSAEAVFDLQDDLVPRIVSTVADASGVLVRSMIELVRARDPLQLTPHEALLRGCGFGDRYTPAEHAELRTLLERLVQQAPANADCWALLSIVYATEFSDGFNARPDPLGRALAAARRAVEEGPAKSFPNHALAKCLFFMREFRAFRVVAERALELNPFDATCVAGQGMYLAYAGDWERGCGLVMRAHELNPHHAGWFWFPICTNAYRQGDYRGALEAALKINMPAFYATHVWLAATYAQLNEPQAATKSLQELLVLRPDIAVAARSEMGRYNSPELVEHIIDGLRKAGLAIENPVNS